jgi:anthranilate phosphoribosyltransferase
MSEKFRQYVKILGRGQRAGRSLSQGEAYDAFRLLLSGNCTAEQRGAFLMLLRVREETPEELAGFLLAARTFTEPRMKDVKADLDIGCYAGKRRHLPWFLLSTMVLAQQGYRIFLHGTQEPDSKRLYLDAVLNALGLPIASTPAEAAMHLQHNGMAYLSLKQINSALYELIQLREQLGLRSCANTLARMLKPSYSACSFQGVFHRHVDEKHATIGQLLNEPNLLCFRGEGGEVELNPEREVTVYKVKHQQIQREYISPLLAHWQVKSKVLTPSDLIDFYLSDDENGYAYAAVTGTAALMLSAINQETWAESQQKAQKIWRNRDRTAFINYQRVS